MKEDPRTAVIVIHGMGNQYPMDTVRGFAEALQPDEQKLYSSPNRITGDGETRRISFSKRHHDFFEYYWAHQVDEPSISKVTWWLLTIALRRKPSTRIKPHLWKIYLALGTILVIVAFCTFLFADKVPTSLGYKILSATAFGAIVIALLPYGIKSLLDIAGGQLVQSMGDVLKYTVPSPDNIAARERIRKSGIELLTKLHEATNEDGQKRYNEIIVVGHSLGSIVAYDIIASTFVKFHTQFPDINPHKPVNQKSLDELRDMASKPIDDIDAYQKKQREVFLNYRKLGNAWRVGHFITLGAPLTHGGMLLAQNEAQFTKRKQQREFPTSPPVFDEKNHFAYGYTVTKTEGEDKEEVDVQCLHHAAHFAPTQWTNIYFENDWVGGHIGANEFGNAIKNHALTYTGKGSSLPLTSHTSYWNTNTPSLTIIKDIIGI